MLLHRVCWLAVAALTFAATPAEPAKDQAAVKDLYRVKCQQCHMADGKSPIALLDFSDGKWSQGSEPADVAEVISEGLPGTAMLPFKDLLTPREIAGLAAYVRAFDPSLEPQARPKNPKKKN